MIKFHRIYSTCFALIFLITFFTLFAAKQTQAAYECDTKYKNSTIAECNKDTDCFYYQGSFSESAHCANKYGGKSSDSCGQSNIYCYADQNCSISGANYYCEQKTYDTCKPLHFDNAKTSYSCYQESFAPSGWVIADSNHKCANRNLICYYNSQTIGEPVTPVISTNINGTISITGDSSVTPDKVIVNTYLQDKVGGTSQITKDYALSNGNRNVGYNIDHKILTNESSGNMSLSAKAFQGSKEVGSVYNTYTVIIGASNVQSFTIPVSSNPTATPIPGPGTPTAIPANPGSNSKPTEPGYCGDENSPPANATPVNGATCSIASAVWENTGQNEYCKQVTNDKYLYFYICPNVSGSGSSAGAPTATPTLTPPKFSSEACKNAGGPIGYLEPRCGAGDDGKYDAAKITANPQYYTNKDYFDVYICKDEDANGKPIIDVYKEPSANTATNKVCNKPPWTYTIPSGSPTPTDVPGSGGYGDGCKPSLDKPATPQCKTSLGLFCRVFDDDKDIGMCQDKDGVIPTPTPGASKSCAYGNRGVGCACGPTDNPYGGIGGCGSAYDCLTATDNPNNYYCVPHATGQFWCEKTKTAISPPLCASTTPTATPTPVASLQCPYAPVGQHICATSSACDGKSDYKEKVEGNAACAAHEPLTPICCMKTTSSGGAAPTATPTPGSSSTSGTLPKCEATNFQCQAGISGLETDNSKKCVAGWSPSNERGGCTENTICCKAN